MPRALLVVCLALATVVAASGAAGRPALAPAPFAADIEVNGHHLTTVGGAVPIVVTGTDGVEHALTRVVSKASTNDSTSVDLAGPGTSVHARVTIADAPAAVDLTVAVTPADAVAALRIGLAAPASAHFLGTGERDRFVDLKGTVQPLKVWNGCGSSQSAPFFASTAGFGAYVVTDVVGRIAFPNAVDDTSFACDLGASSCSVGPPSPAVRICLKAATARLELYAGTAAQTVAAYVRHAGTPQAPWLPHFALMKWRDSVTGPAELLDDISELRSRGLPIGWVILDNPWEQGSFTRCFGSLAFDPVRYPDPRGVIAQVHRRGVKFMLWISPQLQKKGCPNPGYPTGWLTGDDEFYLRDLTNTAARTDFVARLQKLAALGIDGFKADRGDETNLEQDTLAGGSGVDLQNVYPRLYAQAVAAAMRPYRKHWASLFRSAAPGSPSAVPGFVAEDTEHSWNGLYAAIRMGQTASLAGEAMWGSDIGGYAGGEVTPDLFVRWAQFAATTPIFEVGGIGTTGTFWTLGPRAVSGFRDAATLHYTLVPYLYELVREASLSGAPVLRPLGLTWPEDRQAWRQDAEYTVGDALLAAPVDTQQAQDEGALVYLPRGTWIDWFTGRRIRGGRTILRAPTATGFPLYVRAGTAFAADFRDPEVWSSPWRPNDLSRAGRQGWVVAPSAGMVATARSNGATLSATTSDNGDVTISLRHAQPEQQLRVHVPRPVCSVAGIPRRATVGALREERSGWLLDPLRSGTVVVKAHVAATAAIVLRACA